MPVHNKEISDTLSRIADLLDIKGENEFRVRAYSSAVQTISGFSKSVAEMVEKGEDISSLPNIGDSIAQKIEELVKTGKLRQLKDLEKEIPAGLIEIMKLEQMGPERTKMMFEELDVRSVNDLKKAAQKGEIAQLKGFGKKISENILQEIGEYSEKGGSKRIKFREAEEEISALIEYLEKELDNVSVAGSFRRKKETVGDIDMEQILKEAKNNGCYLEINSNPDRLDLNDDLAKRAKEMEVKLSISTDVHSVDNLKFMKYGIAQARRGWLEKDDVLNTHSWAKLKKLLKRN